MTHENYREIKISKMYRKKFQNFRASNFEKKIANRQKKDRKLSQNSF